MSRRRRERSSDAAPRIEIVCTDRGRHRRRIVQRLTDYRRDGAGATVDELRAHVELCRRVGVETTVDPDAGRSEKVHKILYSGPEPKWASAVPELRPDGGRRFRFVCPDCGRMPQIREERLEALLDGLYERAPDVWSRHRFDVSYLD